MKGVAAWVVAVGVGSACSGDEVTPGVDAAPEVVDAAPDGETPDVAPDSTADTVADVVEDIGEDISEDVGVDTAADAFVEDVPADLPDATSGGTFQASVGGTCPPGERVAWVEIERMESDTIRYYVNAWAQDRAHPAIGEPAQTVGACLFYEAPKGCAGCEGGETCGVGGVCAPLPVGVGGATVAIAGTGDASQSLVTDEYGYVGDWVSVDGSAFAVTLSFGDVVVEGPALEVPADLSDVTGILSGDYDNPESVQINWSGGEDDAAVFTHIPINHHVGGQTFTRCTVSALAGSLVADGAVLLPLAVSTGLEFQGIEHVRSATASTSAGCVEFRYLNRIYVPLF